MRFRHGTAALVLTLAAGCGSSQASTDQHAAAGSGRCGPASAQTLAKDGGARVYQRGGAVYGCSIISGRTTRLGSSASSLREGRIGPIALAGSYVAYGLTSHGVDTGTAQVVVRNLRDGKVLHTAAAVSRVIGAESFQSVTVLAVKPNGSVGWIGQVSSIIGHRHAIEVDRFDSRGQAVLDRGFGIAPQSLRLRRSRLVWSDSGHQRSAPLK